MKVCVRCEFMAKYAIGCLLISFNKNFIFIFRFISD